MCEFSILQINTDMRNSSAVYIEENEIAFFQFFTIYIFCKIC